mgnify:CR=1 FL=1
MFYKSGTEANGPRPRQFIFMAGLMPPVNGAACLSEENNL